MKPAEVAATPWVSCWPRSFPAALAVLGPLALVLFVHGQSVYRSPAFGQLADQGYHLAALEAFDAAWRAGEFPPSWDADSNGGRGSPGFVLYPPLFAFVGAVVMRLGVDAVEALRINFLLSAAALFAGVYYLSAGFAPPQRAALGAAAACLLPGATFPSLARGMYPGFLALAWFAVLLGALNHLTRRAPGSAVALALASAALVLTHTLTAYMALWILLSASPWIFPALGRAGVRRAVAAALAALALTAWFWWPMLLTAAHSQTAFLAESHPYMHSLLGADAPASTPMERSWHDINSIGQVLGVVQLGLAATLVWSLRGSPKPLSVRILPFAAVFVAVASIAPCGDWLALLPGFDKLQFAWRWQGPLAVLCGAAMAAVPRNRLAAPGCLAAITVAGFLPLTQPAGRPWREPTEATRTYNLAEVESLQPAERAAYLHNRVEMRPLEADRRYYPPGAPGRWELLSGEARVSALSLSPSRRSYRIEATTPVRLRLFTYHFPGWRASVNGRPIAIYSEPDSGLQQIVLPPGTSLLDLRYLPVTF